VVATLLRSYKFLRHLFGFPRVLVEECQVKCLYGLLVALR
jgi:hypothetical protein